MVTQKRETNNSKNPFSEKSEKPKGGRPTQGYILRLGMAKGISMIQRNEKVDARKRARTYEKVEELAAQKYFMTYKELSEYLNISKPTIEERLVKNGLRYYKVGSKYLFKKNEVDAFLDGMTSNMNATNNDIKLYCFES
nr:excisionase family DNA-binding protein [Bacillus pseudomycoides]